MAPIGRPLLLDQLLLYVIDCVCFPQVACKFEFHKDFWRFMWNYIACHYFLLLNVLILASQLPFVTQQGVQCVCTPLLPLPPLLHSTYGTVYAGPLVAFLIFSYCEKGIGWNNTQPKNLIPDVFNFVPPVFFSSPTLWRPKDAWI